MTMMQQYMQAIMYHLLEPFNKYKNQYIVITEEVLNVSRLYYQKSRTLQIIKMSELISDSIHPSCVQKAY